jgi:hypothetical protein
MDMEVHDLIAAFPVTVDGASVANGQSRTSVPARLVTVAGCHYFLGPYQRHSPGALNLEHWNYLTKVEGPKSTISRRSHPRDLSCGQSGP